MELLHFADINPDLHVIRAPKLRVHFVVSGKRVQSGRDACIFCMHAKERYGDIFKGGLV